MEAFGSRRFFNSSLQSMLGPRLSMAIVNRQFQAWVSRTRGLVLAHEAGLRVQAAHRSRPFEKAPR